MDVNSNGTRLACLGNYRDIKFQLIITAITMFLVFIIKERKTIKNELLYFIFPCIIATIPFSIMGYFPPRTFLPYECLIIIVMSNNVQIISEYFKKYKYYNKVFVGICVIVTVVAFIHFLPSVYGAVRYIFPYKIKVTNQLEEAKQKGEKDVIVSKFLFMDKIRREDFINIDNFFLDTSNGNSPNVYGSLYYGFDSIRAISDIDYFVEINTDIKEVVDYGIIDKDTLELILIIPASDKIGFAIPKEKLGTYVVDCRDKDLRSHVTSVRIRAVGEEVENPDLELLINQEK